MACTTGPFGMRCLLPWDDIDEEVKHVALRQCRCNVGALQGAAFILLRMNPGAHSKLSDKYVAAFRKEYGCFGGNHFDFGVGLHDFLYPCQWQLVEFVVVFFIFELIDGLLPVRCEDVAVMTVQTLRNLRLHQYCCSSVMRNIVVVGKDGRLNTFANAPLYISGAGTEEEATSAALAPYYRIHPEPDVSETHHRWGAGLKEFNDELYS